MTYSARTELCHPDPADILSRLTRHWRMQGFSPQADGTVTMLTHPLGRLGIDAAGAALAVTVQAGSEEDFVQMVEWTVTGLSAALAPENPPIVWQGDPVQTDAPPQLRVLTVAAVTDLTPRMRRITFTGARLERFRRLPGLHIRALFPRPGLKQPRWPVLGAEGQLIYPPDDARLDVRAYTLRRIDIAAGEVDIDFVLHGDHGVASAWASRAAPGDVLGALGPTGRAIPASATYVLAGDETALPAMSRILEELDPGARGHAIIEIADRGERQALIHPAAVRIRWIERDCAPPAAVSPLADAVCALSVPDPLGTYFWLGAEGATYRAVKAHWQGVMRLTAQHHLAVPYWDRGKAHAETT